MKIVENTPKRSPYWATHLLFCPACRTVHGFDKSWVYDLNPEKPTITPSIKITWADSKGQKVCHFKAIEGKLHYCGDCTHALSGQVVDMVDVA